MHIVCLYAKVSSRCKHCYEVDDFSSQTFSNAFFSSRPKVKENFPLNIQLFNLNNIQTFSSDPGLAWYTFMEIDHEIFSMVILLLPLIKEGLLSVTSKSMCRVLVNS